MKIQAIYLFPWSMTIDIHCTNPFQEFRGAYNPSYYLWAFGQWWYFIAKVRDGESPELIEAFTKVFWNRLGWSQIGIRLKFVWFDPKICDSIDSKGEKKSKNSIRINSQFVRLDLGWSQIFQMLDSFKICSIRFENLWFDWFESWKIIRKIR